MRYWSILFGLAAVFAVGCFVYSPFSADWWVPVAGSPPHVISKFGREIDSLYIMILFITGDRLHRHPDRLRGRVLPVSRRA